MFLLSRKNHPLSWVNTSAIRHRSVPPGHNHLYCAAKIPRISTQSERNITSRHDGLNSHPPHPPDKLRTTPNGRSVTRPTVHRTTSLLSLNSHPVHCEIGVTNKARADVDRCDSITPWPAMTTRRFTSASLSGRSAKRHPSPNRIGRRTDRTADARHGHLAAAQRWVDRAGRTCRGGGHLFPGDFSRADHSRRVDIPGGGSAAVSNTITQG